MILVFRNGLKNSAPSKGMCAWMMRFGPWICTAMYWRFVILGMMWWMVREKPLVVWTRRERWVILGKMRIVGEKIGQA
tara:strand:- start:2470 stop:2703 length:234 start_codon:yes stop_codon:yes gene_type:complete